MSKQCCLKLCWPWQMTFIVVLVNGDNDDDKGVEDDDNET